MSGHELYEELAAGLALDALEPQDEELFLAHVAGCARCERELAEHRATAAELAYGAGAVRVPEGMLGRLHAALVAESGAGVFDPASRSSGAVRLSEVRRRRRPSAAVLAAAAAAVLVAVLAGSNVALRQARVEQVAASDGLSRVVETLSAANGRNVPLIDGQRHVAAVAVVQGDHVSLVVEGMDPNEDGTTYVLWEQSRSGGVRAVRAFDVHDGGVEVVRDMPLTDGADGAAGFAITHEQGEVAPARPLVAPLASGAVEGV